MIVKRITFKLNHSNLDKAIDLAIEKSKDNLRTNPRDFEVTLISVKRHGWAREGYEYTYLFDVAVDADESDIEEDEE